MIKLSKSTVDILSNYAKINSSILIQGGNSVSTVSKDKTIFSKAIVDEDFDQEFAIYDLDEFLNTLSLYDSPQLILKDEYMIIVDEKESKLKTKYFYTNKDMIFYSNKELKMPEVQVNFILTSDVLDKINKATAILKVEDLLICSENDRIVLNVLDVNGGTSSNSISIDIGSNDTGSEFKYHIKNSNLKLIKGEYTVSLLLIKSGDKVNGMANFLHNDQELSYFVAIEKDSFYTE